MWPFNQRKAPEPVRPLDPSSITYYPPKTVVDNVATINRAMSPPWIDSFRRDGFPIWLTELPAPGLVDATVAAFEAEGWRVRRVDWGCLFFLPPEVACPE
jgi:hypothetical protein